MRKVLVGIALVLLLVIPLGLRITGGPEPAPGSHATRQAAPVSAERMAFGDLAELATSWIDPVTGENRPRLMVIRRDGDGQFSHVVLSEGVRVLASVPLSMPRSR